MKGAIAFLGGQRIVASVAPFPVRGSPAERKSVTVTLRNLSGAPVDILGASAGCGCIRIGELPEPMPAGGMRQLSLDVDLPDDREEFAEDFVVFTNAPGQRQLWIRIAGVIKKKTSPIGE